MQLHRVEPNLHPIFLGVFRHPSFGRKQSQLSVSLGPFIESLDYPAPRLALAIVDLAQIQHRPLHHATASTALALDNAPIAMLFAVLQPSREF